MCTDSSKPKAKIEFMSLYHSVQMIYWVFDVPVSVDSMQLLHQKPNIEKNSTLGAFSDKCLWPSGNWFGAQANFGNWIKLIQIGWDNKSSLLLGLTITITIKPKRACKNSSWAYPKSWPRFYRVCIVIGANRTLRAGLSDLIQLKFSHH